MINIYLIIILLYVAVYALLKASYSLEIQSFANEKTFGYKQLSVFTFPLLYLFFTEILGLSNKNKNTKWVHFILPFLFFIFFQILKYFDYLSDGIISSFYIVYFLFNVGYLLASLKLFKPYLNKRSLKMIVGNRGYQKDNWILFIFFIWTLLCLRLLILIIVDLITDKLTVFENGIGFWSILIIAIFVKLLISPELLYGENILEKRININTDNAHKTMVLDIWKLDISNQFNNKQDKQLALKISENLVENIIKIEHLVFTEKIFRNSDFDLHMLSKKVNIPKSHLTYIFKYHCTLFFSDFKKMLQIKDAENLIQEGYLADNTLDSLSNRVGFSSYSPFFSAFKKYTGLSPNNYNNQ
ncbi:hypothetical protein LCGC14_1060110 [marine sediment metagenome]